MAWTFSKPLYSLTTEDQNKVAMELWEAESMGGIMENNNRLPVPVVYLLILTIVSAFLITFPLWGQRPTAAIYEPMIALMETPEVQALPNDKARMDFIVQKLRENPTQYLQEQLRHPVTMDDLRALQPSITALKQQGVDLEEYTVLGDQVVLANFEGNVRPDGTIVRKQPWWDKGYAIDIFYVIYFCLAVMIVVKRLPSYRIQPVHGNEREDWGDVETPHPSVQPTMGGMARKVSA
ncbi:MAG: hypothetical protein AB1469_00565 [Pseudomonadota bacterium]